MAKRPPFNIPGTRFEKPEKRGWWGPVLFLLFVILTLAASVWLFKNSSPLKALVCDNNGDAVAPNAWGDCHDEE